MSKRMNFFKRIKYLFLYFKLVKSIKKDLWDKFSLRVDNIGRIYTVLNIPDEVKNWQNIYNTMLNKHLKSKIEEIDNFFHSKNMTELTDIYELSKIDEDNWLLVIGYKYMNLENIANFIFFSLIFIISGLIITGIVKLFLYLF